MVEVAIGVAGDFAIGQERALVHVAVKGAFERNREPVELLHHAERGAGVHVDRQLGEAGLQVRTAGIIGRDEKAILDDDLGIALDVDAAVDPRIEIRNIERGDKVLAVLGVGAADVDVERMALPIGVGLQFRRHDEVRGGSAAGEAFGIGIVAGRQFDRGKQQERARLDAERRIGIACRERQRPLRHGPERQGIGRRRPGRRRAGRGIEGRRRRHWHDRTGAVGGGQRMHFGRRIAHRLRIGRRR